MAKESLKQDYRQFLNNNFKGLRVRRPLFYSWDYGLRFNLQVGETDTDEYFEEVVRRAFTIFNSAFKPTDTVFLVFMDFKYKRRKIRLSNYIFRQINKLIRSEVSFTNEYRLYEPNDKFDKRNVALLKLKVNRINIKNILTAIGYLDFPPRQPRLDEFGVLTGKEVHIINIDKRIIFNMYDDRGLDLIASDKETLSPIYLKHNDWILEYDRKEIDEKFA